MGRHEFILDNKTFQKKSKTRALSPTDHGNIPDGLGHF